jgi:uncharacterized protein YacL
VLDLILVRGIFILVLTISAYALNPFHTSRWIAASGGVIFGLCIIFFEMRLERVSLKRLIGAACGSVLGIVGAFIMSLVLAKASPEPFLQLCLLLLMTYIGLIVGAKKGDMLNLSALGGIFGGEKSSKKSYKILDTSVIIDGRIVGIVESGFLGGDLVVPSFVLAELQRIADAADPERRVRGRRGLDMVRKLMAVSDDVEVADDDYDDLHDVDSKLVRLGQERGADILTTDFNLGKVAEIKGVRVLNINVLAGAVKTAVLPGEQIEVKVLREGREPGQGVGYLDDGTMVVVEDGRSMVGVVVGAQVTSVLQNPAGKMIFAKVVRA